MGRQLSIITGARGGLGATGRKLLSPAGLHPPPCRSVPVPSPRISGPLFPEGCGAVASPLVLPLAPVAAHRRRCQAPGAAPAPLAVPIRPSSASWVQAPVELCFLQFPIELLSLLFSVADPLPFVCIPLLDRNWKNLRGGSCYLKVSLTTSPQIVSISLGLFLKSAARL